MRLIAFLFLSSLFAGRPAFSQVQPEMEILEQLVSTTRKNLENQERVLRFMRAYLTAREAYLADPDNGRLATSLVKKAMLLQQLLNKEQLMHLFEADFLTEIAFYHHVGKQQIPAYE